LDVLDHLAAGFSAALLLQNLALALLGVTIGTLVGVLPGLGPATTLSLLLPVTFSLDATGALVMFAGLYYGSMYGGSTTAILMNVPGETASIPTTFEGYPMARRGRGGAALTTAAVGSFVAGTVTTVGITFLAPVISDVGKSVQPAEYFAIIVFAFVTVTALVGNSVLRGMTSLFVGLGIGVVGIDALTGQARYTFGIPSLNDGIPLVAVAVGLFAVSEALTTVSKHPGRQPPRIPIKGKVWMSREEWKRSWRPWLRGIAVGFPIGSLPAGGAEIPTFLSYNIEKTLSKRQDEWGKGAIEGVAGPEAANNASSSGTMVPLLTLGIPTSSTAAVMLLAFQMYNIQPGPLLFDNNSGLVWTLIASLYIGNLMLLVLNLPMIKLWVKLLALPEPLLTAGILIFATLGVWSISHNIFDVLLAFGTGLVGFVLQRSGFPIAPIILGSVLGPLLEQQFRRAVSFSSGDLSVFVSRPASAVILGLSAVALFVPMVMRMRTRRRLAPTASGG